MFVLKARSPPYRLTLLCRLYDSNTQSISKRRKGNSSSSRVSARCVDPAAEVSPKLAGDAVALGVGAVPTLDASGSTDRCRRPCAAELGLDGGADAADVLSARGLELTCDPVPAFLNPVGGRVFVR